MHPIKIQDELFAINDDDDVDDNDEKNEKSFICLFVYALWFVFCAVRATSAYHLKC